MNDLSAPSPFCVEHLSDLVAAPGHAPLLDLACGRGRHALAVARAGRGVIGLDRNPDALSELRERARRESLPVSCVRSDVETRHSLPLIPASCPAVLVFRFLYRPLAPALIDALLPGGWLLYETFTQKQADLPYGPSNASFLLEPRELLELFAPLEVVSYWEGETDGERPEHLARLCARRRSL